MSKDNWTRLAWTAAQSFFGTIAAAPMLNLDLLEVALIGAFTSVAAAVTLLAREKLGTPVK